MTKIFFFSPTGYGPMKDEKLKGMIEGSHGWQDDGVNWVYGVVLPRREADPSEVADYLESLGVHVIPGVHDGTTDPHSNVIKALVKYGVKPGHKGLDVARQMHGASGMPSLRPHLF